MLFELSVKLYCHKVLFSRDFCMKFLVQCAERQNKMTDDEITDGVTSGRMC